MLAWLKFLQRKTINCHQQVTNQLGTLTSLHRGKMNYVPKTFGAVELCDEWHVMMNR
jgi:hypothetical protein